MPRLNDRQRKAVVAFIKTGVRARAYHLAGYNVTNRASLDAAASRLFRNVKVKQAIERERQRMTTRADVTLDSLLTDLDRIMSGAERELQFGAARGAVETKAKLVGMLVERKETGLPGDFAALASRDAVLAMIRAEYGDEAATLVGTATAKTLAAPIATEATANQIEPDDASP